MDIEEAIKGFNEGRRLVINRKDAPLLPDLLKLVEDGFLESELVEYDEQGSYIRFWKKKQNNEIKNPRP